jgi:hypothetical protein
MSIEKNEGSSPEPKIESDSQAWKFSHRISRDGRMPMTDQFIYEFNDSDIYLEKLDHNDEYLKIKNNMAPIKGKQVTTLGERYTNIVVGSSENLLASVETRALVHPKLMYVQYTNYTHRLELDVKQLMVPTIIDRNTIQGISERTFLSDPSPEELRRLLEIIPQFMVEASVNEDSLEVYGQLPKNGSTKDTEKYNFMLGEDRNSSFWVSDRQIFLEEEWQGNTPNQYRLREESDRAIFEISSNETDLTFLYPSQSNVFVTDDRGNKCNLPALSFGVELSSMSPETLCKGIRDEIEKGNVTDEGIRQHINPFLRLL